PDGGARFYSVIRITRTILPTGGQRVWYLCPSCNRRCARLYLLDQTDRTYRCRLCLNAAYHVQYRKGPWGYLIRDLWQALRRRSPKPTKQLQQDELSDVPPHIAALLRLLH